MTGHWSDAWSTHPYYLVAQIKGQGPVPIQGFNTEAEAEAACRAARRNMLIDPGHYSDEVKDFCIGSLGRIPGQDGRQAEEADRMALALMAQYETTGTTRTKGR